MAAAEEVLKVRGMSCNHCKMAVEKALRNLPGVDSVSVDLSAGLVRVAYQPGEVNHEKIARAIDQAGYQVVQ